MMSDSRTNRTRREARRTKAALQAQHIPSHGEPTDAPIFTKGDRVRDPLTGKTGTHEGVVYAATGSGYAGLVTLVHWDGTGNPVPWRHQLEHE